MREAGNDGRLDKVAFLEFVRKGGLVDRSAAAFDLASELLGQVDVREDLGLVLLADESAEVGGRVGGVAHLEQLDGGNVLCDKAVKHGPLDKETTGAQADLTLVLEARAHDGGDCHVHVGVSKDDAGILAAQLERQLLVKGCRRLDQSLGRDRAAGERDDGHLGVRDEGLASLGAGAKDNVDHARRDGRIPDDRREQIGRVRRELGGLGDAGAPVGDGGRNLPREQVPVCTKINDMFNKQQCVALQGQVPRRNQARHTDRVVDGIVDAPGLFHRARDGRLGHDGVGKRAKVVDGARDFKLARELDGLALVHRFRHGKLLQALLDAVGDAAQRGRAVVPGRLGPPGVSCMLVASARSKRTS